MATASSATAKRKWSRRKGSSKNQRDAVRQHDGVAIEEEGDARRNSTQPAAASWPKGWIPATAGFMSGLVARVIVAPLDVLKVRMQVETATHQGVGIRGRRGRVRPSAMLRMAQKISRREGARALWKGTLPGVLLWAPYTSIQFAVLESINARLNIGSAAAGTIAGLTATFTTFPMDTLRTVLAAQSEPRVYRSPVQAIRGILHRGGIGALYSGLGATVLEVAPFSAVEFGVYAFCRNAEVDVTWASERRRRAIDALTRARGTCPLKTDGASSYKKGLERRVESTPTSNENGDDRVLLRLGSATSGMIAGTAARIAIHPLDVVKKRLQVGRSLMLERGAARFYGQRAMRISSGDWALGVAARIVRSEGVAGLFRGIFPGIVKASVSSALCFSLYESLTAILSGCDRLVALSGGEDDDCTYHDVKRKSTS